jgi:hypothetical protein
MMPFSDAGSMPRGELFQIRDAGHGLGFHDAMRCALTLMDSAITLPCGSRPTTEVDGAVVLLHHPARAVERTGTAQRGGAAGQVELKLKTPWRDG